MHHAASDHAHGYGFMFFIIVLGVVEFSLGLYGKEWNRNEKALDLACFAIPKLVFAPFFAWFSLTGATCSVSASTQHFLRGSRSFGAFSFSALLMT